MIFKVSNKSKVPIFRFKRDVENHILAKKLRVHCRNSVNFCLNINPAVDKWKRKKRFF